MIDADPRDDLLALSRDELQLLRFTCDLTTLDESPLGPLAALSGEAELERAARSLVERGLVERATLRPSREVVRRLLVIAQPDARVVLLRSDAKGAQRTLDCYQRAGAFVPYRRAGEVHQLGRPIELEEVIRRALDQLPTRRSGGDFVDFTLESAEYFAFCLLAADLTSRARRIGAHLARAIPEPEGDEPSTARNLALAAPPRGPFADEGTPIQQLLGRLPKEGARPVPGRADWDRAIGGLVSKDLIVKSGTRAQLRPFLHDLALGLTERHRIVLTRFDFCEDDWIIRDATMISVPGSLFLVRAVREGALRIVELDREGLRRAVGYTVEDLDAATLGE